MIVRSFFITLLLLTSATYAQSPKTGEFITQATPSQVLGSDAATYSSYIGENETLSWEIYVPEDYNPSNPAGIMVYAGAPNDVRPPVSWLSVMKDKNLIWVAARKSDNGSSIHQKKMLAMMSVPLIQREYSINMDRVYITGEGRTASRTALEYPEIFDGAIFIGNKLWEDNAEEKVKNVMNNRYIFVTREKSAIPKGNRYAYNKFKKAGVENSKLILIQGNHRFTRLRLSSSIDFLDE